jgi:hypothetical protein
MSRRFKEGPIQCYPILSHTSQSSSKAHICSPIPLKNKITYCRGDVNIIEWGWRANWGIKTHPKFKVAWLYFTGNPIMHTKTTRS